MTLFKTNLLKLITILLTINCTTALASANAIVDQNPEVAAGIEKMIRQNIDLRELEDTSLHPIILNEKAKTVRNPFDDVSKEMSDSLAKQGIDLSEISKYKAIAFSGKHRGKQSRRIINDSPSTVLVISKGTQLDKPIFSRGPVVIEGDWFDLPDIFGTNIVWFRDNIEEGLLEQFRDLGMPLINGRKNQKSLLQL